MIGSSKQQIIIRTRMRIAADQMSFTCPQRSLVAQSSTSIDHVTR
jgi:Trp operon repressor